MPACLNACLPACMPAYTHFRSYMDFNSSITLVGCLDSQAMGMINDLFEARKKADKDCWQGHTLGPGPSPLTNRQEITL